MSFNFKQMAIYKTIVACFNYAKSSTFYYPFMSHLQMASMRSMILFNIDHKLQNMRTFDDNSDICFTFIISRHVAFKISWLTAGITTLLHCQTHGIRKHASSLSQPSVDFLIIVVVGFMYILVLSADVEQKHTIFTIVCVYF